MERARKSFGLRLRSARVLRGITASALASSVGVSQGAISQYEKFGVMPRPEIVAALAASLSVPQGFFFRPAIPSELGPIRFRSYASATKRARLSAKERLLWLAELVEYLEQRVSLPECSLPTASSPAAVERSGAEIERAAESLRAHWGMGGGPIDNLTRLLESKGIVVSRMRLLSDALDGFSLLGGRPLVVVSSSRQSAARYRFDLAHELGHLMLHQGFTEHELLPETHKVLEREAHRFAGAFLFPGDSFRQQVYSLSTAALLPLKEAWGISLQAIARRARDLGLVSKFQYERCMLGWSRLGYRTAEPLDERPLNESPTLIALSLEAIESSRLGGVHALLRELQMTPEDLSDLAGVSVERFIEAKAPTLTLVTSK